MMFFFSPSHTFSRIPNCNLYCVMSFGPHFFYCKLFFVVTEESFTESDFKIEQMLIKLGSSRLAVQSHRHFDLTCQQQIDVLFLVSPFS